MSNPYTLPTGDGYLGVWQVSGYHVEISIGTFPDINWKQGDDVYVVKGDVGLEIVEMLPESSDGEYLAAAPVHHSSVGTAIGVPAKALRELDGLENGDDVRAYRRDGGGMVLVLADPDPFLDEDGHV